MPKVDTLDKVIGVYMACVCAEPFEYKGRIYKPKPLQVSPLIFRGYTCPAGCGGCCTRFSLDYLPHEKLPEGLEFTPRTAVVNGKAILVLSDMQDDHRNHHCRNLDMETGRCNIHGRHPFSCDFELIRFLEYADGPRALLIQKLYGRGHAMLRIDGERGALCEMTDPDDFTKSEVIRKLLRLEDWSAHFGIATKLSAVIAWVASGPHDEPLKI